MSTTNTPKLKLYYFDIQGKGEAIRLFCAYAGLDLIDHRLDVHDRTEFAKLKEDGILPFGQVPLLEVDFGDGKKDHVVQSSAILRYLARLAGLYPEDLIAAAKVDAICEQAADAFLGSTVVSYSTRFGIVLDDEAKRKCCDMIGNEVTPRHLAMVEKILAESTTGWIANTEKPSQADFVWYVDV